jgi:hypothetical protein
MLAGEFADAAADIARPGERHHGDIGIGADRLAGFGAAGQDVEHALGQAGFLEHSGDDEAAGHDSARIGLEHHRVAGRECRPDGAHGKDQRKVERRDDADDTARHPPGDADAARFGGQHDTLRLGAHGGRAIKTLGHQMDFESRLGRNAAGFARDPRNQLFLVFLKHPGGFAQDSGPLLMRRCCPAGLRGARFTRGPAHIGGGRIADAGDFGSGRRLEHIQRSAGGAPPFGAEYESFPGLLDQEFRRRYIHCVFLAAVRLFGRTVSLLGRAAMSKLIYRFPH